MAMPEKVAQMQAQNQRIRFGITVGFRDREMLEALDRSDEVDSIWTGGHIFWRTPTWEPLTSLSLLTAVTKRLRVGTSVLILPLYNPVILAKALATLDTASGGRIEVGVGVGGENPREFAACGVPVEGRGSRTSEYLRLMKAL
jgi:alkanesulfonate monooxygenase SsuD/methylene tetrahydromethanopterin reductase-like flavin-dependent oxidoreductase (luciferase family)